MASSRLNKSDLLSWGIFLQDSEVYRTVGKRTYKMKEHIITTKHKYTKDRKTIAYVICVDGKTKTIYKARLFYCWYVSDIPAGMEVDHIDNNPFNNNIDNLQLLTHMENIAKKFTDNPNCNKNHYTCRAYIEQFKKVN